jgi:hypothetical protein
MSKLALTASIIALSTVAHGQAQWQQIGNYPSTSSPNGTDTWYSKTATWKESAAIVLDNRGLPALSQPVGVSGFVTVSNHTWSIQGTYFQQPNWNGDFNPLIGEIFVNHFATASITPAANTAYKLSISFDKYEGAQMFVTYIPTYEWTKRQRRKWEKYSGTDQSRQPKLVVWTN